MHDLTGPQHVAQLAIEATVTYEPRRRAVLDTATVGIGHLGSQQRDSPDEDGRKACDQLWSKSEGLTAEHLCMMFI